MLLAGFRSVTLEATDVVFVSVPGCSGFTARVIVAEAPPASVPMAHVTVVAPFAFEVLQVPWLGIADTKVT